MKGKTLTEQQPQRRRGGSKSGRKITRLPLTSLAGLIKEAGTVYRLMRANKLDHEQGRALVWVLGVVRSMLEAQHLERIEAKLDQLAQTAEARGIGYGQQGADREVRLPH